MQSKKTGILLVLASVALLASACGGTSETSKNSNDSNTSGNPEIKEFVDKLPTEAEEMAFDEKDYTITGTPWAFQIGYYTNIYSRGFNWVTNKETTDTKLYLVKGENVTDEELDAATPIEGTNETVDTNYTAHKVHVENLEKGQVYTYKAGSEAGWKKGQFFVEVENPKSVTAIQLSDAQTKAVGTLHYWRNTFKQARIQAAKGSNSLDFVLYNGDQFDQNASLTDADNKKADKWQNYGKAIDCISDYKTSIPYLPSSGNHEPKEASVLQKYNNISWAGEDSTGTYYSYDYGFAHFIVLNTNLAATPNPKVDISDAQMTWLTSDLEAAKDAKWKIVMMHCGAYATGDHCSTNENSKLVEKLTPLFSSKHVDLVMQAHEHTFNKTLPYKWDAAGNIKRTDATSQEAKDAVINYNVQTETIDGKVYDKNPNGTYYVTTGAAGGRFGASEADGAGEYAEAVKNTDPTSPEEWLAFYSKNSFMNNTYLIENGKIKYDNQYEPWSVSHSSGSINLTSDQHYEVGHLATGNVNANMFGILNLTETTLDYDFYTVNDSTVKLFDSVNVVKK